ncbi:MAG TPA: sulfotransferase [Nocardioidaceae bacterium]|nr:sulfotransferase [Nocardioidaceae bacterium]
MSSLLPDVYLVGAPKAGTTYVASWLAAHPEVFLSQPKEPYYWASDYPRMREHYGFARRPQYEGLFRHAQGVRHRVDASTTYLYSTEAVPDILASVPDARFIVCVRNPVDLVVSYHRTQVVALNEPETDFERAWRRGGAPIEQSQALDPKLLDYRMVASQGRALQRLHEIAGHDRVHVIVFGDLLTSPDSVWAKLLTFLDLTPATRPESTQVNASTKTPRWRPVRRAVHRPPRALAPAVRRLRQWARTSDLAIITSAKAILWKPEARPEVTPAMREELRRTFRSDVEMLGTLIGRDLSCWLEARDRPERGETRPRATGLDTAES